MVVQQMGACTLSRDAFRFSDGVELKAATQVVCEHVQLLPGAIGGIAFSGHDVESELAAQFGEGFLLAASPSSGARLAVGTSGPAFRPSG